MAARSVVQVQQAPPVSWKHALLSAAAAITLFVIVNVYKGTL